MLRPDAVQVRTPVAAPPPAALGPLFAHRAIAAIAALVATGVLLLVTTRDGWLAALPLVGALAIGLGERSRGATWRAAYGRGRLDLLASMAEAGRQGRSMREWLSSIPERPQLLLTPEPPAARSEPEHARDAGRPCD